MINDTIGYNDRNLFTVSQRHYRGFGYFLSEPVSSNDLRVFSRGRILTPHYLDTFFSHLEKQLADDATQ